MNPTATPRAAHRGGGSGVAGGVVARAFAALRSLLPLPLLLLLLSSVPFLSTGAAAAAAAAAGGDDGQSSSSSSASRASRYDATATRRERNLDHWDSETLAAYLGLDPSTAAPLPSGPPPPDDPDAPPVDRYPGHDAAVMFYAQWDKNSHAVAPVWDAVATHVKAGTKESNLIMALFDCEKSDDRLRLCASAGVTHYPTLLFVGAGAYRDTDPITRTVLGKDRSAGPAGATTLPRTVKFQGSLQYGDEILDWIRTMQGLSSWHKLTESGALRFVREGVFGLFGGRRGGGRRGRGGISASLPVGVPPSLGGGGNGGGGGGLSKIQADKIEAQLEKAKEGEKSMKKVATHASCLIDAILFPPSPPDGGGDGAKADGEYVDPFERLTASGGWDAEVAPVVVDDGKSEKKKKKKEAEDSGPSAAAAAGGTNPENQVLRYCLIELSLDYCTRVNTHVTNDYLDALASIPDDEFPSYLQIEKQLKDAVNETEPFCELYNDCVLDDFTKPECRPKVCPYKREVACRYMASCFEERVVDEYAAALGIVKEGESLKKKKAKAGAGREEAGGGGGGATEGKAGKEAGGKAGAAAKGGDAGAATATAAEGKDAKAAEPSSGEAKKATTKRGWGMK